MSEDYSGMGKKIIIQTPTLIKCPKCEKLIANFTLEIYNVKNLNLASPQTRCINCDYPIGKITIIPQQ